MENQRVRVNNPSLAGFPGLQQAKKTEPGKGNVEENSIPKRQIKLCGNFTPRRLCNWKTRKRESKAFFEQSETPAGRYETEKIHRDLHSLKEKISSLGSGRGTNAGDKCALLQELGLEERTFPGRTTIKDSNSNYFKISDEFHVKSPGTDCTCVPNGQNKRPLRFGRIEIAWREIENCTEFRGLFTRLRPVPEKPDLNQCHFA
ncbi:hypothetical protein RUM44_010702 [Polyplax serrata]|uniref:Uncharacterized protein n=1 Tax=Polyplax serrata TaxID=468196 RepID=A0ABR1AMX6_POLSC